MRKILTLWLLSAVIGILGVGWYLLANTSADNRTAIPVLSNHRPITAGSDNPTPPIAVHKDVGTQADIEPESPNQIAEVAGMLAQDERRLSDPSSAYFEKQSIERATVLKYQYVFDSITLSPELRRRVMDLLYKRELKRSDLEHALLEQGIYPGSSAYAQAIDAARNEFAAELSRACGSDFATIYDLIGLNGEMLHINVLMSPQFEYFGVPLTAEQKVKFAYAMKAVGFRPGRQEFVRRLGEAPEASTGLIPIFRDLAQQASAFLTPEQVAVIKHDQDRMLAARRPTRQ